MGFPTISFWEKLKDRVTLDEQGCWIANTIRSDGYGKTSYEGETRYGHSVTYEIIFRRRIRRRDKLTLDHMCKKRACWNPWHLEITTYSTNILRGLNARENRSYCGQGHLFDEENTRIEKNGQRHCRRCQQTWNKFYRKDKKDV